MHDRISADDRIDLRSTLKRLAILLPALAGGLAWGQEARLPTIVVTESREAENAYRVESPYSIGPLGSQKLLDIPNSIAILPASLIENVQATSLKEALKYLPLTQFQEQQGTEVLRPATRGMQGSNFQNTRLDGMTVFVTGPNPLESYQQIEVLSGASSAVYGPANPAGTFNFVSKRPTGDSLLRLNLGYDSDSIFTAHADVSGKVGDSGILSYRVNLLEGHGTAFVSNSQLDRKMASVALDVRPAAGTKFELNFSEYDLRQLGYPGWFTYNQKTTLPYAPDPTKVGIGQAYAGVDMKNHFANVRLIQDLGPDWHLVVGGLMQQLDRNIDTPVNNLTNNAGNYTTSLANGFAPRFDIVSDIAYLNGVFRTGDVGHDLTLGTTGFRANTNSPQITPSAANVLLGSANISNPLVFAQPAAGLPDVTDQFTSSVATQQGINISDTMSFTRQWALKLALSQDWMGTKNFNKSGALTTTYSKNGVSPMPSVIYKPRDDVTTYLSYANSLQQGDIAPAGSANANTGLAPYRSKQWEAGVKAALSKIDLSFAAFRLERPFANVDPSDNTFKIMGQQVNTGVEAMAVGKITNELRVYGGVTYMNPVLEGTGNPATNNMQYVGMPKLRSNLLFEYWMPSTPGLVFSFDWQYAGKRFANDSNTTWTPSYTLFDVGARYTTRIMGKSTTWRLAVNNLNDARYWSTIGPSNITGTNAGNMTAHLGAPRIVAASATIDF